jgi:hypothetical protein
MPGEHIDQGARHHEHPCLSTPLARHGDATNAARSPLLRARTQLALVHAPRSVLASRDLAIHVDRPYDGRHPP